eukprot:CAMPEP_0182910356 /NCGR_PEP_ID=MMETSP0034_2-20130328/36268_1 /TAXON_ID=156128 /ORGANISM="Nephroselmis pyriformis, Strain CCMP717" /LENGTH=89 /DNA_ID=CAMNT_0025046693 /DNA_START=118 /DNA_END=383 /DNA_ORIENTATION=+
MFRNSVSHLDAAVLSLRVLPELRELSLDGNPVSRLPQYRSTLVRELPQLERLDEEPAGADEERVPGARAGEHDPCGGSQGGSLVGGQAG